MGRSDALPAFCLHISEISAMESNYKAAEVKKAHDMLTKAKNFPCPQSKTASTGNGTLVFNSFLFVFRLKYTLYLHLCT